MVGIGFKHAKDLKTTDVLLTSAGKHGTIQSIEVEKFSREEQTYNFEVEGFHTYYVGNKEILVHNKCWATQRSKYRKEEAELQRGAGKTYTLEDGIGKNNLNRMAQGKPPIGFDGKPVELHHVKGRNFDRIGD